jgi:hypothetical protein
MNSCSRVCNFYSSWHYLYLMVEHDLKNKRIRYMRSCVRCCVFSKKFSRKKKWRVVVFVLIYLSAFREENM